MSNSHDPNVRQARVHFPRICRAYEACGRGGRVHVLGSGAQTYGLLGEAGEEVLKAGMDEVKNPSPGNFIHARGERVSVYVRV